LKGKIDRDRKLIIFKFDDPRVREGIEESMPFDVWFEFSKRITEKISKCHRG
jgi:hypothetical protein